MHKSRIVSLAWTVFAMAMTLLFIVTAWREAGAGRIALLFAPLFGFVTGIGAIAVLLPNSWYRHRERVLQRNAKRTVREAASAEGSA